jgi:hypothetical protein
MGKRYVYFWVNGVYFATRLEEARHGISRAVISQRSRTVTSAVA